MPPADPAVSEVVLQVLAEAQEQGLVGPGPLEPHLVHSLGFADAVSAGRGRELGPGDRVADLGTGGGLPGLVLADVFLEVAFTLIEGSTRRAGFLGRALGRFRWEGRVEVARVRAEVAGRQPGLRGEHTVVVSRLFGPPAATAECAAALLETGGLLVVSEPPDGERLRWPAEGLAQLGLTLKHVAALPAGRFAVLEQARECPDRYPRRNGVPAKKPLF